MLIRENIHINEGIYADNDKFVFDFVKDDTSHFINLKYFNNYVKTNVNEVYYSYTVKRTVDKYVKRDFLKALKYKDENLISSIDYDKFLNKAVLGLLHSIPRDIDLIVFPKSSSPLNFDIAQKIKARLGHNTYIGKDLIIKNSIENIRIDSSKVSLSMLKSMIKNVSDDTLTLKSIPPQFRKYFSNFLIFDNDIQRFYYNKLKGNVLLVDDILTKGSTIKECQRLIDSLYPNFLINYVLIKG